MKSLKILSILSLSLLLTACDIWSFNGGGKTDDPTGGGTGKVGDAQELILVDGSGQVGQVNQTFGVDFVSKVVDSKNRPIVGDTLNWKLTDCATPKNVMLNGQALSDNSGTVSINPTPNFYGCGFLVVEVATSTSAVLPLEIPLNIIGPATSIVVDSGDNQSVVAGNSLGPISIRVLDPIGQIVPNASVLFNGTSFNTNSSGAITYNPSPTSTLAGSHNITVALANGNDSEVLSYSVSASSVNSLSIVSGDNQSIQARGVLSDWTIEARDIYNNLVSGASIALNLQVCITNGSGVCSITPSINNTVAGNYSLVATSGGASANVNYSITAGPASTLTIISNSSQTITAGQSLAVVSARLTDLDGNRISGATVVADGNNLTTNSSGEVSFSGGVKTVAGSFNMVFTSGALSTNATYQVNPGSPAVLTKTGGDNQIIVAGNSLGAISVNLKDAFGNNIPNLNLDFSGTTVSTDSNGDITHTPSSTPTTSGNYQITVSVNALSQVFDFSIVSGPLASLEVVSGDLQILPRGVNSNNLIVRGRDSYGNPRTQANNTITFADGSGWSSAVVLNTSGLASVAYPTPLIVGNKTITASSGAISTSFGLSVLNYSPLTAIVSTSDDLTYSVITERTYLSGEITYLGSATVSNTTVATANTTLTKTGTGTLYSNGTVAETNLSTSITNVSSPSDVLSITTSATLPSGVSTSTCSFNSSVISGISCVVNSTITFNRDQILGGNLSIRVQSGSPGASYDFLDSNILPTSKKIIIKKYNLPAGTTDLQVAGGDATDKVIYIRDNLGRPAYFDYQNETFTQIANNISIEGDFMFYFGGRFLFRGNNPNDSNNQRMMAYDPTSDTFSEAFRITTSDNITYAREYNNRIYSMTLSPRRTMVLETDGSSYWLSATQIGQYFPLRQFGGVEYGYLNVLTAGIYRLTSATQITRTWNGASTLLSQYAETTNNGFIWEGGVSPLIRFNDSTAQSVSTKEVFSMVSLGSKLLIATKDSSDRNKIFVWDDADNSYKKLRDFNTSADDFSSTDMALIGFYNNNAYLCVRVGGAPTIYSYDGTKLSQLANTGVNCSRTNISSKMNGKVVDNALWFGTLNSLYKICDQNLGCN